MKKEDPMNEAKKLTKQYRLEQWTAIIRERINSGKRVNEWCAEHGISRDAYYYWLRKVKIAAAQEKAATGDQALPKIVPLLPPEIVSEADPSDTAIIIRSNGIVLEIKESASDAIIERTLRALKRTC